MGIEQMYQDTLARIEQVLQDPKMELGRKYGRITDLLLASRVDHLRKSLIHQLGDAVVQSGPFAGLRFHSHATEGCYIPKLLGCYEAELHGWLTQMQLEQPYDRVINVGCAEGYYAVGLARCLPEAQVLAFDINPQAQAFCKQLAELNDVAQRVVVGGRVNPEDWVGLVDGRVLIVSDCEGAEYELLNPVSTQGALRQVDLLIELHWTETRPELAQALLQQYAETHTVDVTGHGARNPNVFNQLQHHKHLDQLLAMWEFRGGPTPWAYLRAKAPVE